jgi:hypothetical protein
MENKHFDRLVGLPTEYKDKQDSWESYAEEIIEKRGGRKIEEFEIEKSPRDMEIISIAEECVRNFLKEYGRDKELPVSPANIHYLRPNGTKEFTEGRLFDGGHASTRASILIDRIASDAEVAVITFHELFHLLSYKAFQVTKKEKPDVEDYRSGFAVTSRDGEETYFQDFEEAIIGLATSQFFEKVIKTHPLFQEEMLKREQEGNAITTSRQEELNQLNALIDDLYKKNSDRFSSRDEITRLFIDAQVNGHLLQVGRLIENTYGKGSFREIGKGDYQKIETKST